MPQGARPKATQWIEVHAYYANPGGLSIATNGQITLFPANGIGTIESQFTSLDNISFPTN